VREQLNEQITYLDESHQAKLFSLNLEARKILQAFSIAETDEKIDLDRLIIQDSAKSEKFQFLEDENTLLLKLYEENKQCYIMQPSILDKEHDEFLSDLKIAFDSRKMILLEEEGRNLIDKRQEMNHKLYLTKDEIDTRKELAIREQSANQEEVGWTLVIT